MNSVIPFVKKIEKSMDKLKHTESFVVPDREPSTTLETFRLIDAEELSIIVFKLNTKSCEMDMIPTKFLRELD